MADFPKSISTPPLQQHHDDVLTGPFRNWTAGAWSSPSSSNGGGNNPSVTSPSSSSSSSADNSSRLLLVGFLMALIFLCCVMVLLIVRSRLRLQQQQQQQPHEARGTGDDDDDNDDVASRKKQILEERIRRRFETIEAWLVTKQVLRHDDTCTKILHRQGYRECPDDVDSIVQTQDVEHGVDTTHTGIECPVCMCPMKPNEWASWSANEACVHVFHRTCIKPWLLKRMDCPCCRNELLPIDQIRGMDEKCKAIDRLTVEHRQRLSRTYCCDTHGLVILRSDVTWSASEADDVALLVNRGAVGSGDTVEVTLRMDNSESEASRRSRVIGRTGSEEEEVGIKPDESERSIDVELGNEEC